MVSRSSRRRWRWRRRTWSAHVRLAIESSHSRTGASPRNCGNERKRAQVGLLDEVLDLTIGTEHGAHLPHRRLGAAHELGDARRCHPRRPPPRSATADRPGAPAQDAGNRWRSSSDLTTMTCERWREAISARADGEALGVDERLLDAHLRRCEACRDFAATGTVDRCDRVLATAPPADLPRRVARRAALADRASTSTIVRVAAGGRRRGDHRRLGPRPARRQGGDVHPRRPPSRRLRRRLRRRPPRRRRSPGPRSHDAAGRRRARPARS